MNNYRWYKIWPNYLPYDIDIPHTGISSILDIPGSIYKNKNAIIYYGNKITYSKLMEESSNMASFIAKLGFGKGNRIGLMMQNSPQFIISFFAIAKAGATIVLLSPALDTKTADYIVKDTGIKLIITTSELLKIPLYLKEKYGIDVISGSLKDYIKDPDIPVPDFIYNNIPNSEIKWNEAVSKHNNFKEPEHLPDDEALIAYTSGTTGIPKGCIHTNKSVMANAMGAAYWRRLTSSAVELSAAPFFHVTGLAFSMLSPVYAGATVVPLTRWNSEAAIQSIEKYKITHFVSVTPMVVDLLNQKNLESRDLSSIRFIGGGGAAMPETLTQKMENIFKIPFIEGYGMTETMGQTHINPPEHRKFRCIGIPQFGYDAVIIDQDSNSVVYDGIGEIAVSGPSLFTGYLNKADETEKAFININGRKYLRTGDIGYMDDDGSFFVVDRLKRMINRAGFKVWPTEIDSLMVQNQYILEACTVGTPDIRVGEEVKSFVVLKPESRGKISESEIVGWAKNNIGGYKYPHVVEFIDSLPRTASGKMDWKKMQDYEKNKH